MVGDRGGDIKFVIGASKFFVGTTKIRGRDR